MKKIKDKLLNIKMPHTYVILTVILVAITLLTYVIPAGEYTRVLDSVSGKMVVISDSFHLTQGIRPGVFDMFLALQRGYVSASDILFLIVFAYGYVYMLTENGTLNSSINMLIRILGNKTYMIIPVCMFIFGVLGSTMGIFEEVYGLVPVFIGIGVALGYDIVVGGAIVFVGVATGFAAATTNPFSIGIAQSIAEVPLFSGIWFQIMVFIVFQTVAILYVMNYAKKVKNNPEKSIMYGEDIGFFKASVQVDTTFTLRQKICLALFFCTIGTLLYGATQWGWYINEIAAMFLMMMVLSGFVGGYSTTQICKTFISSTKEIVPSILVIGFTRGILLVMQDAKISDTIVYYMTQAVSGHSRYFSAVGMLALQNIINFFITGSSSQATITMPIMAPVADIVGIGRQTAVIAYCFGDGFSDMFWPTACALQCGLMNIPLNKWYKFMAPLFGIMVLLQVAFILLSVVIFA